MKLESGSKVSETGHTRKRAPTRHHRVCVGREGKDARTGQAWMGIYDSGVVPLLLLFVIFAVRAPNCICAVLVGDLSCVGQLYVRLASSRMPLCTCPTAKQDI
jgi:hypothetical protein